MKASSSILDLSPDFHVKVQSLLFTPVTPANADLSPAAGHHLGRI
jgi:hypothetical protein